MGLDLVRAMTGVVAGLGMALAVASCQQALSIDGAVVVAGPTRACGIAMPAGACAACVASQCCAQATACAGDPACSGLETCQLGCGADYACRATCVTANLVGTQADVPALDACVASSCGAECGLECGTAGSYAKPADAQACQDCIAAYACDATNQCASSVGCETTGHCAYACRTPDCLAACLATGQDADVFTSTVVAVGFHCVPQCDVGHYWFCAGRVTWPTAKSTTPEVTLTLQDPNPNHGGAPLAGFTVKACEASDLACAAPLTTGTTDGQGKVTLPLPPLPATAFGFEGYFDVASPTGTTVPYLYVLPFPLSEADAQLTLPVPTLSDVQKSESLVGVTPDPQRGILAAIVQDCVFIGAPGVVVTADGTDAESKEFYVSGGQPSAGATSTDNSGVAYYYNIAPGQHMLVAQPSDLAQPSSKARAIVRAGAMTVVPTIPTPLD